MMIIYIDNSIANSIINNEKLTEINFCLSTLANEYIKGTHIILGERQTIYTIFSQEKILSMDERKIYSKIYNSLATMKCMLDYCNEYMEITSDTAKKQVKIEFSKKLYSIPIEDINSKRYLIEPYMLCENISDCQFFKKFFDYYLVSHPEIKNAIRFSGEIRGGGGSTVCKEYQQIQEERKRFCLCILDSDQEYPAIFNNGVKSYGQTAKDVININDLNEINTQYYLLPVREIENLIPIFFLKKVIPINDQRYEGVKMIESLINKGCIDAVYYYDFKNGIKGYQILNCDNSKGENPFSLFWIDNMRKITCSTKCKHNCNSKKDKKSCQYFIFKGIGDKVLNEFVKWMEETENIIQLKCKMHRYNRIMWDEISKLIFSWYCGLHHNSTLGQPN
jgi:hypothetical protein